MRYRLASLATLLPLALAGCWTPKVVTAEAGKRCEAQGYEVGTDAYVDCAVKLEHEGPGNAADIAPVAKPTLGQVCDPSQPTETPTARYLIKSDIVFDTKTRLTWQRCSVGQSWDGKAGCVGAPIVVTWEKAMSGAREGWRVPGEDELLTLTSPTCKSPAINAEVFPNMSQQMLWYWSATPNGVSAIRGVDFRDGRSSSADSDQGIGAVRLVRSD